MTAPSRPTLEPDRVYRTRDLARWGANPTRLADRLVREGVLVRLRHGLFASPRRGRFGLVPPSDAALLDALLDGSPWIRTGPERWNALGLGSTALFATQLVYNTKRSGQFELSGRRFRLRRVRFPADPPAEWFVVDLMSNASSAGVSLESVTEALTRAVEAGRFRKETLREMARGYATREIQARVERATT